MGRAWDKPDTIAFSPEFWAEIFRVLKPGGIVKAMSGTRTFHRLVQAIKEAGFVDIELDSWSYGCLSEDTEVLTPQGWMLHGGLSESSRVMQWDSDTGKLSWVVPTSIHRYPYKGKLINLGNRHSDQLLTPNHRVYAKIREHSRKPKPEGYGVVEAQGLKRHWHVSLPMAGRYEGSGGPKPEVAYLIGWWLTDAWAHGDGKACMFSQSKPETLEKLRQALSPYNPSEYVKKAKKDTHNDEHTFYLTGDMAEFLLSEFPERKLSWTMLSWGLHARQRLFDGLMDGDGSYKDGQYSHAFWSQQQKRRDIFTALCVSLEYRCHEDPKKGVVYWNSSTSTTQLQRKHRDMYPPVDYEGVVWCVTVPKGAFVVRRNGRPFITGNSGFPKSHNISKYLRKDGKESEAETWEGFGSALKPSWEPIVVARKIV